MAKTKYEIWDEERFRLLKVRWKAEDKYRSFAVAKKDDYPVVFVPAGCMRSLKAPCCGVDSWVCGERLHKCAFCRRYYYVMLEGADD